MSTNKKVKKHEESMGGALFSSIVFVGIPITLFIVLLLAFYIDRV